MMDGATANSRHEKGFHSLENNFNLLVKILIYSSAFYYFSFVTADPDLWGHIKFGEDLWVAKSLHRFDIYSYTAFGAKWINHEWLAELIMFFVYRTLGSVGLLTTKLLVGFAIIYILSLIAFRRNCNILVCGLVFVLSVFVMSPGFMIRPQLFTFLSVAYFLYVFHLYFERNMNFLWTLPLNMALWVNCHGGFLVGFGMFPVAVGCEYLTCRMRNKNTTHLRRMVFWLILTEAAVLINPYGYHLPEFLYKTLSVPRGIGEWNPVTVFDLSYLRFKLLALLFLCSFFIRNRERRYWETGIICIALFYAFMHQRHTPVFAIVAAPYLVENFSIMVQRRGFFGKIRTFSSYVVLSLFLCILVGYQVFFTGYKYKKTQGNIIVDPAKYPVGAVRFLKENGVKGDLLLPFDWGEYAIWKLYPDCRVSIDGRFRTVYPEKVLDDHFRAAVDETKLRELLEKYPADIILGRQNSLYERLISTQNNWIYVYSDLTSIVFIRNNIFQRDVLERLKRKGLNDSHNNAPLSSFFP
jgi:hypothetical protein